MRTLQRLGKSLMLPVACLPVAGILMGIGYWIDPAGWGSSNLLALLLIKAGSILIDNMALLFAVGVAVGMSVDQQGTSGLAGLVSWLTVQTMLSPAVVKIITGAEANAAFGKINNQFIGILCGLIAAYCYNKFYKSKTPDFLAFFSGRRSVPIVTVLATLVVCIPLFFLWPLIYTALVNFGTSIIGLGPIGVGIYGFLNRLLIPVGLHHALNSVFWFDVAGVNDLAKFWGAAPGGVMGQTGQYMAGFFPIMMFGLPGAALAIYHCARPENKAKVLGLMMAGAFAAFFTGITEPLEFSFMFVAPVLYVIHAVLTGISVFIAASMHWIAGFGFSAGLVDMVLSSRNPLATQWYMLLVQGLVFFGLYYAIFRAVIVKFNLKTPGREDDEAVPVQAQTTDRTELAKQYLEVLGGQENLVSIDACITRLRLTLKDRSVVDERKLKALGAAGVVKLGEQNLQVILGPLAEIIAGEMKALR